MGYGAIDLCSRLTSIYFTGNAPSLSSSIEYAGPFYGDTATIYYLPGTTGWSADESIWLQHQLGQRHGCHGASLHEPCQFHLVSHQHEHPHRRFVLFQRSQVDELSRPLLSPPLAVRRRRGGWPSRTLNQPCGRAGLPLPSRSHAVEGSPVKPQRCDGRGGRPFAAT